MDYNWSEKCSLEVYRERPAMRYLITSLGGYFPVIQKLADGSVAVVARDGDLHIGQRGRLIMITSNDGGESWSMPSVVTGEGPDDRNPAFGQAPDGSLVVAFVKLNRYVSGRYAPDAPIDWDHPLCYVTRAENPHAGWSTPVRLPLPPGSYSPYGKMVNLADGTMLMSMYGRRFLDGRVEEDDAAFILRSPDGGRSWGDLSVIASGGFNETALECLPGGRLVAALRREYRDQRRADDVWQAVSEDGGLTWRQPRRITRKGEHPADLLRLHSGRMLLTYGQRNPPYGVRAMVSDDDGESWDEDQRITLVGEAATSDCGYPSSVQLDDGAILTAYYVYESFGPFQAIVGTNMGIHAALVKYDETALR
jgi:hypothetical protein